MDVTQLYTHKQSLGARWKLLPVGSEKCVDIVDSEARRNLVLTHTLFGAPSDRLGIDDGIMGHLSKPERRHPWTCQAPRRVSSPYHPPREASRRDRKSASRGSLGDTSGSE